MNKGYYFASFLLLFVVLIPEVSQSQNLVLNPNRIVFEGKTRKEQLLVNNPSDEEQTYRVTFVNKEMLEDGRYEDIKKEDEGKGKFSDKIIRFSPRTFTLAPRTSQTVRLQLRKKKDMEEGEYRSHMKVSVVPKTQAPEVREAESVNIQIQVHYGITIPVIVRNGELKYSAKVSEAKIITNEDGSKSLKAKIERSGERSVYGDISITHYNESGTSTVLKFLPGVSVFSPNTHRIFDIKLEIPEEVDISKGKLEIKYIDRDSGNIAAEKSISI